LTINLSGIIVNEKTKQDGFCKPVRNVSACAAMYRHARETDDTEIRRLIIEHEAPDNATSVEIPVTLAGKQHNLRFVGTHRFDLKTVLENSDSST
jgi:hypothetical protein